MKILYLTRSYPERSDLGNGVFNYWRTAGLLDRGVEVEVVKWNSILSRAGIHWEKDYSTRPLGFDKDVRVRYLNHWKIPGSKIYRDLTRKIFRLYREGGFDLIHTHFAWDGYFARLVKERFGIPFVMTTHGSDIYTDPWKSEDVRRETVKTIEAATAVICVSEYMKSEVKRLGCTRGDLIVIPNGIVTDVYHPSEETFLPKHDISHPVVGFVGRFVFNKRADQLAEFCAEILKLEPEARFLFVGEGLYRDKVLSDAAEMGFADRLILPGKVLPAELPKYYGSMDVMMLPSRLEGWGCVAIEAQACGVPVVGTANNALLESVGDGGETVPEGDDFPARFAEAVKRVLDKRIPKDKLIGRAKTFDYRALIDREIAVYRDVLGR